LYSASKSESVIPAQSTNFNCVNELFSKKDNKCCKDMAVEQ